MTCPEYLALIKEQVIFTFSQHISLYNELKNEATESVLQNEMYNLAFYDIVDKGSCASLELFTTLDYFTLFAECKEIILEMINNAGMELDFKEILEAPANLENSLAVYCVHLVIDDAIKEFQKELDNSAKE